jgi:hypothetical protein
MRQVSVASAEAERQWALKTLRRARLEPSLKHLLLALLQTPPPPGLWDQPAPRLRRLVVRQLAGDRGRHTVVPVEQALYLFVGFDPKLGLVEGAGTRPHEVRRGRVYLRTLKDLFVTPYRSLGDVQAVLDPAQFVRIHQSIIVNVLRIVEVDASGKRKRLAVALGDGTKEWLTASRRSLPALRLALGMRRRRRPRPG